ncbi:MAG: sigma-70 family RNA polymerase sigma factor [Deltaproteobacteria bacterium]|nr:sigma-70 family RNA polymerase sigma factor [Deltaproteobacteria bacterium]
MASANPQIDIAQLVRRAQVGDKAAFAELARMFLRPAYAVALPIVKNTADAEELAQEALVAALQKLAQLKSPERFAGWLMQIVRNRSLNHLARHRVPSASVDSAEQAAPQLGGIDPLVQQRLLNELRQLTELQQHVVLLHDMENWTHTEIGAALEISVESSRQHLFQARRRLRESLGKRGIRSSENG